MYAGPHRRRLAFFLDVVAAISDERPGMAIGHHVGPQVAAIGAANRDGASVAIEGPGFAGNLAVAYESAQVFGGSPSGRPSVGHAVDLERIAINHADGLGKRW